MRVLAGLVVSLTIASTVLAADSVPKTRAQFAGDLAADYVGDKALLNQAAAALVRARNESNVLPRPAGSFLLSGEHGSGKSEFARALARQLYGGTPVEIDLGGDSARVFEQIDNMKDEHSSGEQRMGKVINFSRVDQASPAVQEALKKILSSGELLRADGYKTDLRSAIIVAEHSAPERREVLGFASGSHANAVETQASGPLSQNLTSLFDVKAHLSPLDAESLGKALEIEVRRAEPSRRNRNFGIKVSKAAIGYLHGALLESGKGAAGIRALVVNQLEDRVTDYTQERGLKGLHDTELSVGVKNGSLVVKGNAKRAPKNATK